MKNRIVENWLTNTNELSYQIPFCQILIAKGYKLLHVTRHGPFEQGKDVIAINKDGIPCAFQLKGGDITLSDWRNFRGEVEELLDLPIVHPSLHEGTPHESYLITNGQLSEEVRREIDDRNRVRKSENKPILHTIVKGELVSDFNLHFGEFIPADIPDLSEFLKLSLHEGEANLDKQAFFEFLKGLLNKGLAGKRKNVGKIINTINSLVVITSYLLASKYKKKNHVAIIDGWVLVLSLVFQTLEKYSVPKDKYESTVRLVFDAILLQSQALVDEINNREHYVEGNPLHDVPYYKPRITILNGYLAAYGLHLSFLKREVPSEITSFLDKTTKQIVSLGESMIPFFINLVLFRKLIGNRDHSEILLAHVIISILQSNKPLHEQGFPDPYLSVEDTVQWYINSEEMNVREYINGSYTLKSLVLLLVTLQRKDLLEKLWRRISYIQFIEYFPEEQYDLYEWNNRDTGKLESRFPVQTQSWSELVETANTDYSLEIPSMMKKYPEFIPYFICTFPHRVKPSMVLYMNSLIQEPN